MTKKKIIIIIKKSYQDIASNKRIRSSTNNHKLDRPAILDYMTDFEILTSETATSSTDVDLYHTYILHFY